MLCHAFTGVHTPTSTCSAMDSSVLHSCQFSTPIYCLDASTSAVQISATYCWHPYPRAKSRDSGPVSFRAPLFAWSAFSR